MATRLKTIEFGVPTLATLADNTLTAMTTIKAYIPEFGGSITFKKCIVKINVLEGATMTTGNYSSRRIDVSVAGASATSYTNANTLTGSGEQGCIAYAADCTLHFASNWTSGTSQNVAISVLVDSTASAIAMINVQCTLTITYEYDDAQTTQIKTVRIPLATYTSTCPTSKPGSPQATIPALDTELPETSKTIRSMFLVLQGNINNTASKTNSTLSVQVETYTTFTTGSMEMGATSDYWLRLAVSMLYYDSSGNVQGIGMATNVTRGLYLWGSVARFNHPQAYLVVTYEFDASATTDCFVSVMIPTKRAGIMGGTASTDFIRMQTELWIEEGATITTKQLAFYGFWEQAAAMGGLNARLGTGSFVTYTDAAALLCGSNGLHIVNNSAYTLARGPNTLVADFYRTDTSDFGWGLDGFFIINYTCAKPSGGYGAANHTVIYNAGFTYDGAAATNKKTTALGIAIPETNYWLNGFGALLEYINESTGLPSGVHLYMERTNSAGQWTDVCCSATHTDTESGSPRIYVGSVLDNVKQWPADARIDCDYGGGSRLDVEETRRWWVNLGGAQSGHFYLDILLTYHTVTFTIAGAVTGKGAGICTTKAHRSDTGDILASTTVYSGAGSNEFSLTWYDNTIEVYVESRESGTLIGRSDNGLAV